MPTKAKANPKTKSNASKPAAKRLTQGANVDPNYYHLRLYVAGQTRKSLQAVANLRAICEAHLPGHYSIEVVDLILHPELARKDQILAIPTLVRQLPPPAKKIIGDLSRTERVLLGLEVEARPGPPAKDGQ